MTPVFQEYYGKLPAKRRQRLQEIEATIMAVAPEAHRSIRYRMPTFETAQGLVSIGNQKHYLSVYTCSAELIESYVRSHPGINHGKGCLRFSDTIPVDLEALKPVFAAALTKQGAKV